MTILRRPEYDFRAVERSVIAIKKAAIDRQRAKDESVLGRRNSLKWIMVGDK